MPSSVRIILWSRTGWETCVGTFPVGRYHFGLGVLGASFPSPVFDRSRVLGVLGDAPPSSVSDRSRASGGTKASLAGESGVTVTTSLGVAATCFGGEDGIAVSADATDDTTLSASAFAAGAGGGGGPFAAGAGGGGGPFAGAGGGPGGGCGSRGGPTWPWSKRITDALSSSRVSGSCVPVDSMQSTLRTNGLPGISILFTFTLIGKRL